MNNKMVLTIVAGIILLACLILTGMGVNTWVKSLAFVVSGYLFGSIIPAKIN